MGIKPGGYVMKQRYVAVMVAMLLVVVLAACSGAALQSPPAPETNQRYGSSSGATVVDQSAIVPADGIVADGDFYQTDEEQTQAGGEVRRVILRTASLSLVVDDANVSLNAISSLAEEMGGWVVSSNTYTMTLSDGSDVAQGSITIRVPSERLDEAMNRIKDGGGKVDSENVTGQDVTQEYVDLTSRLTNLEAAEAQLREIMADAVRTEDVMTVYNQLVQVRGEIEQVRGQIQYYDQAAAYSSISVTLTPTAIDTPIQIAGWSPGRTVENALATLLNLLRGIADIIIMLVIVVLPLVVLVVVGVWIVRLVLRRVRRTRTA